MDLEEKYFYDLNRDLIENQRKRLDEERGKVQLHCPKCGTELHHTLVMGIRFDECPNGHGVFIDAGEIQTLINAKKPHAFLASLQKIFTHKIDQNNKLF